MKQVVFSRAQWVALFFKGMGMGAADIVPGVSGGTIAFITGIYHRLLLAISSISLRSLKLLRSDGLAAAWRSIDGTFLTVLALGVVVSILSLARLISFLLQNHAEPLWSFFFGLIIASAVLLVKSIPPVAENEKNTPVADGHGKLQWRAIKLLLIGGGGLVFAYGLTELSPAQIDPTATMLFFAGAIAISAMILPGISGSFILVLLGLYEPILNAIKSFDLVSVGIFMGGCLVGILCFARLLSWLMSLYQREVFAFLIGIMIGSLNKVWPWKETLTFRINSHGEQVPLMQANVLPHEYLAITGIEPNVLICVISVVIGAGMVMSIEWFGRGSKA